MPCSPLASLANLRKFRRFLLLLLALSVPLDGQAQTVYSWTSPTVGGTWSTSSNWTVTSGNGSTNPDASDTAILGSVTAGNARLIAYDSLASGTVGTLSILQNASGTNELSVTGNLSIASSLTLAASGGGVALLYLNPPNVANVTLQLGGGGGNLTVGSGGVLQMAMAGTNAAVTLGGSVTLAGGRINLEQGQQNATVYSYASNFSISSGTLTLGTAPLAGTGLSTDNRFQVNGTFASSGGAVAMGVAGSMLALSGAVSDLSGLNAFDTRITVSMNANRAQTLKTGTISLGALLLRAYASGTTLKTVTATTGTVGAITLLAQQASTGVGLLLGGNLTAASLAAANFSNGATVKSIVDTGTYTLTLSSPFTPNNGNTTNAWTIQGNGAVVAPKFDLSPATDGVTVSSGVTLTATAAYGALNSLSSKSGTISAASCFLYQSGQPDPTFPATLVSTRTIGALTVAGNSKLRLSGSLCVAGNVTVAGASDTLDLQGNPLVLTGSANLAGNGTVTSGTVSMGSVSFASGAAGGCSPGVGTGAIGTLTIGGTTSLGLASTGTSTFDIASTSSYDQVILGSNAVTYAGTLKLNFQFTPTGTTTYQLFSNAGTTAGGFGGIVSNLSGYTTTFNTASGLLTVIAPASATSTLPTAWQGQDIGSVGVTGSAGYSGTTYTISGAGMGSTGTADAFRFVSQPVTGDFDIRARLVTQGNTNAMAEAGLMVRNDLTAGAAYAFMAATSGSGWIFETRAAAGSNSTAVAGGVATATPPIWLRLNRAGNVITAYRSYDGSVWITATTGTLTMGTPVYIGLAVNSHSLSAASTCTFDNVSVVDFDKGVVPPDATMTFDDEFDTGALDQTKWIPSYPWTWLINNEEEVYVPGALTFPAGGGLEIVANKLSTAYQGKSYSSGAMTTYGCFAQTYGYFEVKAKIPSGQGLWPAFWLMPENGTWPPEIDVMENLGQAPQTIFTTLHWATNGINYQDCGGTNVDSREYHLYGVAWQPGSIVFTIDGSPAYTITGSQVPSIPMYLLLNLAVGGGWPGSPNASTPFPSSYKVAWVHAFQYNSAPAIAKTPVVFGPTTLSAPAVVAGGTLNISSSLVVGGTALVNPTVFVFVKSFWSGGSTYSTNTVTPGACPANSKTPFSLAYTVPSSLPAGTYAISYSVSDASTGIYGSVDLGQYFTVPATIGAAEKAAPQIGFSGTNVNFTLKSTVPARSYQVQYADDLTSGTWQNLGPVQTGNGGGMMISVPHDSAASRRFFRLKLY